MKACQKVQVDVTRRPKMEEAASVLQDQARARVLGSGKPDLRDLVTKFGGWKSAELSGSVKR